MHQSDIQQIVDKLSSHIDEMVTTTIYEHGVLKDKEVSGLHREINQKLGELTTKMSEVSDIVAKHDEVIQEIRQMYKTAGTIKKFFITVVIGTTSLATFTTAILYFYRLLFSKN